MTRHWLLMFRPETYELVKTHKTIGVLGGHRERFSAVRRGDLFVAYVSRVRALDGYGEVTGNPFVGAEPIFGPKSERYSQRARIEFAKTGLARDAKRLLYGVSPFEKGLTTSPSNLLMCSGGFIEITKDDHEWLVGCMEGRIQPEWENVDNTAS